MNKSTAYNLSSNDYNWLVSLIRALKNNGIDVREDELEEFIKYYFTGKYKVVISDLILLINAKVIKKLSDLSIISDILHKMIDLTINESKHWREYNCPPYCKCWPDTEKYLENLASIKAFDRDSPASRTVLEVCPISSKLYFQLYETIKKYYGYGDFQQENRKKAFNFVSKMMDRVGTSSAMQKYVNDLFPYQEFWTDTASIVELDKYISTLLEIETTRFSIFRSKDERITSRKTETINKHIDSLVSTILDRYKKNAREAQLGTLLVKTKPTENPSH